jgi:6,7-dimethyl-8-ribityllumazine synthase
MATGHKNLSSFQSQPTAQSYKIAIVVSRWNAEITNALKKGAEDALIEMGVPITNIVTHFVPGTFELPLGSQYIGQNSQIDAVLALGCVIQGETRHFDFICDATANGIMNVGLTLNKPVIFGVLTTQNLSQAKDRAGGIHGNKGVEAAVTAIQMLELKQRL